MDASAEYLSLSADGLQTQLQSGKSLADIATASGKSVDGLRQAVQAALPPPPDVADATTSASTSTSVSAATSALRFGLSNPLDQIVNGHPGKQHHGGLQFSGAPSSVDVVA